MARVIVFTSGKGGVGKTTAVCGVGRSLAAMGKRVIIADYDLALANADLLLGVEQNVLFDVIDCAQERARIAQALVADSVQPSLLLLPSAARGIEGNLNTQQAQDIVNKLSMMADYVLIDSPAGTEEGFCRACSCASEAVVVCTPHLSAVRDANKTLLALAEYPLTAKYVLINRADDFLTRKGATITPFEIISLLRVRPIGVLPELRELNCGVLGGQSRQYFQIIAENLHFGKSILVDVGARRHRRKAT